jgi:hypothetical protein
MKFKVFCKNIHGEEETINVFASSEAMAMWIIIQNMTYLEPQRAELLDAPESSENVIYVDFIARKRRDVA